MLCRRYFSHGRRVKQARQSAWWEGCQEEAGRRNTMGLLSNAQRHLEFPSFARRQNTAVAVGEVRSTGTSYSTLFLCLPPYSVQQCRQAAGHDGIFITSRLKSQPHPLWFEARPPASVPKPCTGDCNPHRSGLGGSSSSDLSAMTLALGLPLSPNFQHFNIFTFSQPSLESDKAAP